MIPEHTFTMLTGSSAGVVFLLRGVWVFRAHHKVGFLCAPRTPTGRTDVEVREVRELQLR